MRFKEANYGGYVVRLCDVPSVRHWKITKDGETKTTARTLEKAKEKIRALNSKKGELK